MGSHAHIFVWFSVFYTATAFQENFESSHLPNTIRQGLSYERCSIGDTCSGNRTCQEVASFGGFECSEFSDQCFCTPPDSFIQCNVSSTCPMGEICAQRENDFQTLCASRAAVFDSSFLAPAPPPALPPSGGFVYDDCFLETQFSDCPDISSCSDSIDEFGSCTSESKRCICRSFGGDQRCLLSSHCPQGQVCSRSSLSFDNVPICVAKVVEQRWIAFQEISYENPPGLTLDACLQDGECLGDRFCAWLDGFRVEECQGRTFCACLPRKPPVCFSSADCDNLDEACAVNDFFFTPLCTSLGASKAYGWISRHGVDICPVLFDEDMPQPLARLHATSRQETEFEYQKRPPGSGSSASFNPLSSIVAEPAITGGLNASDRLTRYMVATVSDGGVCSGVLISPLWIMSAAHCELEPGTRVYFGNSELDFLQLPSFFILVRKTIIHRQYVPGRGTSLFDIAVAELESPAPLGSLFMTLNGKVSVPGDDEPVRAIGYGALNATDDGIQDPFRPLRQVDMKTVSAAKCSEARQGLRFPSNITQRLEICSGIDRERCSACFGDSGGPLVTYENGVPILIGIASTGVGCDTTEFPNVHTRVSGFIPWLLGTGADFKVNTALSNVPPCKRGEILIESTNECEPCQPNESSFGDFATECTPCTMGFVQDTEDRSSCSCKGFHALGKGIVNDECVECEAGFFSGGSDSRCERCPPGTTSTAGSAVCTFLS